MTREDVENRWLTVGTESRLKSNNPSNNDNCIIPNNMLRRTIMGEKGIGRLAIAVIAPITLLITRAIRGDNRHNLVAVLVHWSLFEQPGIDIGKIDIPIEEFSEVPSNENIKNMVQQIRNNINLLEKDLTEDEFKRLHSEINRADSIAPNKIDKFLLEKSANHQHLSLSENGHGTHFIVFPTAPELDDDIDGGADKNTSNLQKLLLGFSNSLSGETPVITAEFRDHNLDEFPAELIGAKNFFLPEELKTAEHHINGEFDDCGQFNGTVTIYGEEKPFVCNWPEGRGSPTRCGSFSLKFAHFMKRQDQSEFYRKNPEDFVVMMEKLNKLGGLYIYRNNIRVLPYGNIDFDFLGLERGRSVKASEGVFSYRNIIGYICISHEKNPKLTEKAGREGFIQNQAYREFHAILKNLMERVAREFYWDGGTQAERYQERKEQLTSEAQLLKKQEKRSDSLRNEISKQLDIFFEKYNAEFFEKECAKILQQTIKKIESAINIEDNKGFTEIIHKLEEEALNSFQELEKKLLISKPRGLAVSKKLEKDLASYQKVSTEIRQKIISPSRQQISDKIHEAVSSRNCHYQLIDSSVRIMNKQTTDLRREINKLRNEIYNTQEELKISIKKIIREEIGDLQKKIEILMANFIKKGAKDPEELEKNRQAFERELQQKSEGIKSFFESAKRQMKNFTESLKERETTEEQVGALEQKTLRLEEQLDFYSDFAQMGMAIGILQHEFEQSAQGLRTAVRDMKPWADNTPALKKIYLRLRQSFDHIDGYLKALDPLGKRLNRNKVEISGNEIRMYLMAVFKNKLEDNKIEIKASDKFSSKLVKCRSSALLGAFTNIIDNAIYWVSNGAEKEKVIYLDANDNGFFISNSGPAIEERMRERIFDFGETTKPGGRGMGLPVAREALKKEGFELELIQTNNDSDIKSPVFFIKTITNLSEVENDGE
jgi:signal transduction histidine kinase